MNNSVSPDQSSWSPSEVVGQSVDWLDRIFGWWYKFTSPRKSGIDASFARREGDRRARLTSTIAFFYSLLLLASLPTITSLTGLALFSYVSSIVIIIGSLVVNRAGKTVLASSMLVFVFEAGMAASIVAYNPLDITNFPIFNLFVVGELLAVSLLPVQSVFIVAFLNVLFIIIDILYQPHTLALTLIMKKQLFTLVLIPVMIQIIVACVVSLWVYTSLKANERANKAEMVLMLEHELVEQNQISEREKRELEESIQQLIQAHVDTMNGQVEGRIPYPQAKVLWPLVGVINSLWMRLQRSEQIELSQQKLQQAISASSDLFYHASTLPPQPLSLKRTGTELDPLLLAVNTFQESWHRSNIVMSDNEQKRS